jgi:hypothetical protein
VSHVVIPHTRPCEWFSPVHCGLFVPFLCWVPWPFPEDLADLAAFVAFNNPAHDHDAEDGYSDSESDPARQEVLRALWSSSCMCSLFTALQGLQVILQLAATYPTSDLPTAIAGLPEVDTSTTLRGVYSVCDHLPGVLNRRWGPGAADAFVHAADRLFVERRCVHCDVERESEK